MLRTVLGVIVTVALLAGLLGGVANVEAQSEPQTLFYCAGNTVKKAVARAFVAENQFNVDEDLADATFIWTVPSGGSDMLLVTFSAQCRIENGSSEDFVEIEVQRNDRPMPPGKVKFCSADDSPTTYSATFCERVGPGTHTIQVVAKVGRQLGALAYLGPWTYHMLVSE